MMYFEKSNGFSLKSNPKFVVEFFIKKNCQKKMRQRTQQINGNRNESN